jgi:prophage regulatory protein
LIYRVSCEFDEACEATGFAPWKLDEEIAAGRVRSLTVDGRRLVEIASLLRLFEKSGPQRRIIRLPTVCDKTGKTEQAIRRGVKSGNFPAPISLGLRAIGWYEDEVDAWMAALPRAPVSKAGRGRGTPVPKPGRVRGKPRLTLVSSLFQRLTSPPPDST